MYTDESALAVPRSPLVQESGECSALNSSEYSGGVKVLSALVLFGILPGLRLMSEISARQESTWSSGCPRRGSEYVQNVGRLCKTNTTCRLTLEGGWEQRCQFGAQRVKGSLEKSKCGVW